MENSGVNVWGGEGGADGNILQLQTPPVISKWPIT